MPSAQRYQIADATRQVCQVLHISVENVLRRARLPSDYLQQPDNTVSAEVYFELWRAIDSEAKRSDLAFFLGRAYAHGPFSAPVFSLSCSETIETGIKRLALFKPLMGPIVLEAEAQEDAFFIRFDSNDVQLKLPDSLLLFELVYLIECFRIFSGENIVPLSIGVPKGIVPDEDTQSFFQVRCETSRKPEIVLSLEDARRPLITKNDMLWESLQPSLKQRLSDQTRGNSTAARVRNVLLDSLAGGTMSSEEVAKALHLSKRSLQRRLMEEGVSFQEILNEIRSELSDHYLRNSKLSMREISYLLGFQDPSSFFRAYHAWTGRTPTQTRKQDAP